MRLLPPIFGALLGVQAGVVVLVSDPVLFQTPATAFSLIRIYKEDSSNMLLI